MVPEEGATAADRRMEARRLLQPSRGVQAAKAASATGIVTIGSDSASVGFEGDNSRKERVMTGELRPFPDVDRISQTGGYPPLARGVSTVRYPIPKRIFDYVSTVRSATGRK